MSIAIIPGSFDPVTNGHIDMIKRASVLFDKVVVLVLMNTEKKYAFTCDERVDMIKKSTIAIGNVEVDFFSGMLANYAKDHSVTALIKGVRTVKDYEYEFELSLINRKLNPDLETLLMPTDPKYLYLSSTVVKEVAKHKGVISEFVPQEILQDIEDKLKI